MLHIIQADDHPLFRAGMRALLNQLDPEVVITEAGSLAELFTILAQKSQIDLILLDLVMPGMQHLDGVRAIIHAYPMFPIVVVSANENPYDIRQVLATGVSGYITKSLSHLMILKALKKVLAGDIYQPDILRKQVVYNNSTGFTERQQQVFLLVIEGLSNKEIAQLLAIKERTVKHHVAAILKYFGVKNRTQMLVKLHDQNT